MYRYFYISLSYATFGIILKNGMIEDAAPIGAWMIGRSIHSIKFWCFNKKAKVKEICHN